MSRRDATAPLPQQRSDIEANLMHADTFASQGHVAQAVGLYRTAAGQAEAKRDYRTALTAYAAVARLEGVGSEARMRVGRVQHAMGRRRQAAQTFAIAANEQLQLGRVADGLLALRLAADAEPTAQRWKELVDWCIHLGRAGDAQRHLEEGSAALFAEELYDRFVPVARMLLEHKPRHVPTLRRLVRAHLHHRELHRAVEAIRSILTERPGDPQALEQMAEAFAALGREDKAAEVALRLAEMMLERGPEGLAEANRLVARGLVWRPGHSDLLLLRQRLPGARAPRPRRPAHLPPLDLSEFVEAVPPEPPRELDLEPDHDEAITAHQYELIEILDEVSVVMAPPRPPLRMAT